MDTHVKMYKRPNPRAYHAGCHAEAKIPEIMPMGRVADIITKMRNPYAPSRPRTTWTASRNYELIARFMDPKERDAYIARSEEWIRAHPPPVPHTDPVILDVNSEPVLKCLEKHCPDRPPIAEYAAALRAAGYPEDRVQKAIEYDKRMEETYEKRTADLELIFAKWPAASKSTPKPKPKVIKAVKKKMG